MNSAMTTDRARTLLFRILLVILLGTISYLAFTPIHYPLLDSVWDKLRHAAAFVALALAVDYSFPDRGYDAAKVLPLIAYGVAIEIVQHFLPYRQFDLLDVIGDAIGLFTYGMSLPLIRRLPLLRSAGPG